MADQRLEWLEQELSQERDPRLDWLENELADQTPAQTQVPAQDDFERYGYQVGGFGSPYYPEPQTEQSFETPLSVSEIPAAPKSTDLLTLGVATLFKDPKFRIKHYARGRDLDPSAYGIKDGEIIFRDKDGNVYREEPRTIGRMAKEIVVDPTTYTPAVGGKLAATALKAARPLARKIGTLAGELGAAAGTELGKFGLGQLFGEDRKLSSALADIALESAGALGIEGVLRAGKGLVKGIGKFTNLPPQQQAEAKVYQFLKEKGIMTDKQIKHLAKTEDMAHQFGLTLNLAEKADDITLMEVAKGLKTPDQTRKIYERAQRIFDTTPDFIERILPRTTELPTRKAQKAAEDALSGIAANIKDLSRPFYEAAFTINDRFAVPREVFTYTNSIVKELRKKLDVRKATKEQRAFINEMISDLKVPTDMITLEKGDAIKRKLDGIIEGKDPYTQQSYSKTITSLAKKTRRQLRDTMDAKSPEYKRAREVAMLLKEGKDRLRIDADPEIRQFAETGEQFLARKARLQHIKNLPDREIKDLGDYIFNSASSTPESVKELKAIMSERPDGENVWKQIVGDHIQYQFGKIPLPETEMRPDIGGEMWKSLFGTPEKAAMMEAAIPRQQYENLYNFFDVIRRSGLVVPSTFDKTPMTKTEEMFKSSMSRILGRWFWSVPAATTVSAAQEVTRKAQTKGMEVLERIMWHPDSPRVLTELKEKMASRATKDEAINDLLRLMSWGLRPEQE